MSKKLLCLVSLFLVSLLATHATAQIDPATITDGHAYLLNDANFVDGTVPDSSAVGHTANIIGEPNLVEGIYGNAMKFDGVDDGVHIPDSQFINITNGPWPNRTVIAVFNAVDVSKTAAQVVYQEGGGTRGFNIYVQAGEVIVGGWNKADYTPQWNPGSWISAPINSDEWHTVALVLRDGGPGQEDDKFEMWMDGDLIGKAPGAEMRNHGNDNSIGYSKQVTVLPGGNLAGDAGYFEGLVDEVWILNQALTPPQLAAMAGTTWPYAYDGDPVSGTIIKDYSALLTWQPGDGAVSHDVYLGSSLDDVVAGTADTFKGNQAETSFLATDLVPDTTYYWRVAEVGDDPAGPFTKEVWNFTLPPRHAYNPSIVDGNKILDLSATLTWTGGWDAILHNVHFGTDPAALAPVSMMQADATYDTGALDPDTTYYWRIDEFYGFETITGPVWSFSTVPDIPLSDDPNLVGQWTFDGDSGGVVLDQSGHGGHAVLVGDVQLAAGVVGEAMQIDGSGGDYAEASNFAGVTGGASRTVSAWIKTADYGEIASWGQNSAGQKWIFRVQESNGTLGAIRVEVNGGYQVGSIDVRDDEWHHVAAVLADDGSPDVIDIALYVDGFLENNSASLDEPVDTADGVVRIGQAPWGSRPFNGLIDDVRIYDKAFSEDEMRQVFGDVAIAWQPQPALGTVVDVVGVVLSWTAGDGAAEHDVYLGTDAAAVAAADASVSLGRQADTSLAIAGVLEFGATYYWRVDEVAADGTVSAGNVWFFDTAADLTIYDEVTPFDYDTSVDPFTSEISLDLDPAQNWTDPIGRLAVNYTGNAAPGSVSVDEAAGTTTVVGRGADIFGGADEFQYAYTTITGNGSMTVKVDSLDNTHDWTKAGIMIRETLDPGASFAAVYLTGANGVIFENRSMANQDVDNSGNAGRTPEAQAAAAPVWIKIERAFPMVSASYSTDGVAFIPIGAPAVVPMSPAPIHIGLAVTSHSGAETYATAVFSEIASDGGVVAGPLTSAEIGLTGNAAAPMSLVLTDASGASDAVVNPDPAAVNQTSATDFVVDLADYNIDLTAVAQATLVIGDGTAGGSGSITINNVRLLGPKGPVASWALDETAGTTAADASGGSDGTLVGDQLEWRPDEGMSGGALLFGGVAESHVEVPTAVISTESGTLALWGKLAQPQPDQTRYFFGHTTIPPYGNRIQLFMDNADTNLDLGLGDSHNRLNDIATLELDTWYHIALTWDAGDYMVYVNGQEMGAGTYTGLDSLNSVADIGNDGNTNGRTEGFGGLIDEVLIYDRALTATQVAGLAGL